MAKQEKNNSTDSRVNEILNVIMAYARLDFSKKTEMKGDDALDAIGAGVNMLGEELETSTVSLKEKEQLLKEIHHRVKNNLQIVSSLLSLQTDQIFDKKYLELIAESRNRINSMALVHEMLYSSKDLSKIEISEYIERLCRSVHQSFSKPKSNIKFEFNIEPRLFFDIDHMIPIGLILNETVSNCFKYAFTGNKGQITIELSSQKKEYKLVIKDDGVGLPPNFNAEKDGNLGIQLIWMLVDQLDGKITFDTKKGTAYHIIFPH
jgi:two-component sensor histidine kinase